MVDEIKKLYGSRSKAVHEYKNAENEIIEKSAMLLHRLIKTCVEQNCLPDVPQLLEAI